MRRPAHRCGGVHRHDLAYHQPVEQPTHAGELLLDAGRAHLASRSEEHTSELQSLMRNSYAVFCLKKKKYENNPHTTAIKNHTTYPTTPPHTQATRTNPH